VGAIEEREESTCISKSQKGGWLLNRGTGLRKVAEREKLEEGKAEEDQSRKRSDTEGKQATSGFKVLR
jgi:hypothetical protein